MLPEFRSHASVPLSHAGEVIGRALSESDHLPDLKTQVIGELWPRDLELTAWRVLHADQVRGGMPDTSLPSPPDRQATLAGVGQGRTS